ncbi:MAG: ABC transporter permease [Thaumarchaeota archaeon]|nr:ABC transporter permease [Nitrososphaerota archaeon]
MMSDTLALSGRSLLKWIRSPFSIIPIVIQAIVWLLLFGNSFNPANSLPGGSFGGSLGLLAPAFGGAQNYVTYLTPGVMGMIALTGMSFMGVDFVLDRLNGYLDILKTAPIPRSSIYFGGVVQNIVKAILQSMIVFFVAFVVPNGLRVGIGFGILNVAGIFATIALLTTVFSTLFTGIQVSAKNTDSFFAVVNFLFFPVAFTSTALFPLSFFPAWLKPIAQANPISLGSEAVRLLVVNGALTAAQLSSFIGDFAGLAVYAVLFVALGTMLAKKALKAE